MIHLSNLLISNLLMDQMADADVAVVVLVEVQDSSCYHRNDDVYYCQNMMVLALVDQNLLMVVHICSQNHSVPIQVQKLLEVGINGDLNW